MKAELQTQSAVGAGGEAIWMKTTGQVSEGNKTEKIVSKGNFCPVPEHKISTARAASGTSLLCAHGAGQGTRHNSLGREGK